MPASFFLWGEWRLIAVSQGIADTVARIMVWRALFCLLAGAYGGALIVGATLRALLPTASSSPGQLLIGSAALMIFTLPGSLIVFGLLASFGSRGVPVGRSRVLAVVSGALIGGAVLAVFDPGLDPWLVGAAAGLVTALCCVGVHAVLFPAARARR